MPGAQALQRALCVVALCAAAPGCGLVHKYRQATVLVRDAETKQPVHDAEVNLHYFAMFHPNVPWSSSGRTDSNGVVRLRYAPFQPSGKFMVYADGYHSESFWPHYEEVELIGDGRTPVRTVAINTPGWSYLAPMPQQELAEFPLHLPGKDKPLTPAIVVYIHRKPPD